MSPSEERPVMAAEVMAAADDGQYDTCDLAEAMVAALLACSSSGGPVVIGTDGTVKGQPRLTEGDREAMAQLRRMANDPRGDRCDGSDVNLLLDLIDRLAPPAQDAENQEDNDG